MSCFAYLVINESNRFRQTQETLPRNTRKWRMVSDTHIFFFLGSACQTFYHLSPLDFRNMQMTFVSLSFNKSIHSPFKALGLRNPFNLPFTTLAKMFENVSVKAHLKAWMDPGEKWFLVHFLPESFPHTCSHFSTHVPNFKSGLPFLQLARFCRRRRRHFKRSISRN